MLSNYYCVNIMCLYWFPAWYILFTMFVLKMKYMSWTELNYINVMKKHLDTKKKNQLFLYSEIYYL